MEKILYLEGKKPLACIECIKDPEKTEEFLKLAIEFQPECNSMINWSKEKSASDETPPNDDEIPVTLEETEEEIVVETSVLMKQRKIKQLQAILLQLLQLQKVILQKRRKELE